MFNGFMIQSALDANMGSKYLVFKNRVVVVIHEKNKTQKEFPVN